MVWITATGTKYNRNNNCGNTNLANERQIILYNQLKENCSPHRIK